MIVYSQERRDVIIKETTIFLPSEGGAFMGGTLHLNGNTVEIATGARVSFIRILGPGHLNLREGSFLHIRDTPKDDVTVKILPMKRVVRDTLRVNQRGTPE